MTHQKFKCLAVAYVAEIMEKWHMLAGNVSF